MYNVGEFRKSMVCRKVQKMFVDNNIEKVWRSCGTIMKAGGRELRLNPLVSLILWKVIALRSMLYGCKLW